MTAEQSLARVRAWIERHQHPDDWEVVNALDDVGARVGDADEAEVKLARIEGLCVAAESAYDPRDVDVDDVREILRGNA